MGSLPQREVDEELAPALSLTRAVVQSSRPFISQGSCIGRFLVLKRLDVGSTETVYGAYDPALNRRVAIKLLSANEDEDAREARARLVREAQALAQLSHPAVVAVYEVGEHEGDVFMAMEHVEGQNLRAWSEVVRPWQDVLSVWTHAGHGLAAAHAAGLVHRDVTPENVLIDSDGRVRVMNFGHAAANPAYVAPERRAGAEADSVGDQYSYCVSLFEALYGQRPDEDDPSATPQPHGSKVPQTVHAVLQRGLQTSPTSRFPAMDVLVEALAAAPSMRRNTMLRVATATALVGVVVATFAWVRQADSRCQGAKEKLAGAWDEDRSMQVKAAMHATGANYAPGMWAYVEPKLDTYARAWAQQHAEACEATAVRAEQAPEVLDMRMACLQRAKMKLQAVVDVLASADAIAVRNAHDVVNAVEPLSRCSDIEGLRAEVEPPSTEEADAVEETRSLLSRAEALRSAGRYPDAMAALQEAESVMETVSYGPLRTDVLLEKSEHLKEKGEYAASEAVLRQALRNGARWRQWNEVRRAAAILLFVVGHYQKRPHDAMWYLSLSRGLVEGANDPAAEAQLRNNLGILLYSQGKLAEAEEELRQALALRRQFLDASHPEIGAAHNNLGLVLQEQGRFEEAEAQHRKTLALWERALGPDHPDVGGSYNNLANALQLQGRHAEAEAGYRHGLAIWERAFGSRHPQVADLHSNLATVLLSRKRFAEAEAEHRLGVVIGEETLGPDHPQVATSRAGLGLAYLGQGRYAEAEEEQLRALATRLTALGPDHPDVADSHSALGAVLYAAGKIAEAEAQYRLGLALRERVLGSEHPSVAASRTELAEALLDQGRAAEALALAELAWAARENGSGALPDQAQTAFVLARAVRQVAGDAERGQALAERAVAAYAAAGESWTTERDEVTAWVQRLQLENRDPLR